MSASQCTSSGCESGWTLYLDQSSFSKNQYNIVDGNYNAKLEDHEQEEEDLSMVSDASSGPPHYSDDQLDYEDYCFDPHNCKKNYKTKSKSNQYPTNQHQFSYLDDTASSHVLTKKEASMENVLEFSQGYSATHFKQGKSSLKNHFGFFKSEKPASKEPGGFQGRKRK
ncbi:Protein SOB FIVE-LIKE 5 [Euphorbia peplus]|nr:Protein SOB FIVE-LIKE 5 [Euphorbia peplus]